MDFLDQNEIQDLLDENTRLIKSILSCQQEDRLMDSMMLQARLQSNLVLLAPYADRHQNISPDNDSEIDMSSSIRIRLSRFIQVVKELGLKDLKLISNLTDISLEKIVPLAQSYIEYLKRQNQFLEAQQREYELSLSGAET